MTAHDMAVVVGASEARTVADGLGWRWMADPARDELFDVTRAIIWGPLEQLRRFRRIAPLSAAVWRIDGLALPLTEIDRRLIASLDHLVVANREVQSLVETALENEAPNVSVIGSDCRFAVDDAQPAVGRSLPCVGALTRNRDAASLILSLHRFLHGGLVSCSGCGRTGLAPFDPPTRAYRSPEGCRCGLMPTRTPGCAIDVRLAVTDEGAVAPEAIVRWLRLDERVEVVRLGAEPWQDLADWLSPSAVVVCASSAVDLPTAVEVAVGIGIPIIVPDHALHPAGPLMTRIATRTETGTFGHVGHVFDSVAFDRALRMALGSEPPDHRPSAPAITADAIGRWRQLVEGMETVANTRRPLPIAHRRIGRR